MFCVLCVMCDDCCCLCVGCVFCASNVDRCDCRAPCAMFVCVIHDVFMCAALVCYV